MRLMLYKLFGIIDLNFGALISFLIGILFGAMLICLLYALAVVISLGSNKFIVKTQDDTLKVKEVKDLVISAQKAYSDKNLRGKKSRVIHAKDIGMNLVYEIASRFYPKKKYPLLELSIDEILILTKYISDRFNEILSKPGLKIFKKFKASQIYSLATKGSKVADSKAFKVTKEVSGVTSKAMNVLNVINPANLVRKVVIGTTVNIITDKLCKVLIALIGEETFKIYSKKVFNQDIELKTNVDELVDEIQNDLRQTENDISKEKASEEIASMIVGKTKSFKSRAMQATASINYQSNFDSNMKMANYREV